MLTKITFSRLFSGITMILLGITLAFYSIFSTTRDGIVKQFEEEALSQAKQTASNITLYLMQHQKEGTFYETLKKNEQKHREFERFLSTFHTHRLHNIFLVDKPEMTPFVFRVLLDGDVDKHDKFHFAEMFKAEHEDWEKVWKTHESMVIYQANRIGSLWATLLYPIVQDGNTVGVLALDFSQEHYVRVVSSLDALGVFLKSMVAFLIGIFVMMILLTRIDVKREKVKQAAQKALYELNTTLEERVKDEVQKNREKDQQLLQQSRLASMGEMLSMIAHQWRQPLQAISTTVQGMSLKISLGKFDEKLFTCKLNDVSNYAQHLSQTINDFRDFFKKSKEKREITLEEIIEKVLGIIRVSIENKNITLNTDFESDVKISTYPNELMQVLLNLVKNAEDSVLESECASPRIEIKTYADDKGVYLHVRDNGGGIAKEHMGHIFDPYFSTKSKKDGTGLGLYMSKKIIEEHCAGILRVENDEEGALFTLFLPFDSKGQK